MTDQGSESFEVVDAGFGSASGLAVRGQVDLASVPALEQALEAAIKSSSGAFMIDLTDLTFLDSSGLLVLLEGRGLLAQDDRALVVVCPAGPVRQVFEVAGVAELLTLRGSREDAVVSLDE